MYEKDKRQRITLRLSDKQFECVSKQAKILGVTPSEYLRMMINTIVYVDQNGVSKDEQNIIKETLGRENDKGDIDDII